MKQPEDNKTSDMFDLDASHNRMPIQASLSKDDQIAKAINNSIKKLLIFIFLFKIEHLQIYNFWFIVYPELQTSNYYS